MTNNIRLCLLASGAIGVGYMWYGIATGLTEGWMWSAACWMAAAALAADWILPKRPRV